MANDTMIQIIRMVLILAAFFCSFVLGVQFGKASMYRVMYIMFEHAFWKAVDMTGVPRLEDIEDLDDGSDEDASNGESES